MAAVLLVFVGFMIIKVEALPGTTPDVILKRYTRLAKWGLLPVLSHVGVIACAYLWLFYPQSGILFYAWSAGFPVALLLFIVYSIATTLAI